MKKQYIKFECQHQRIRRTDDFFVVGGSQKYLYAKFDFCEDWSGEKQYAIFNDLVHPEPFRAEIIDGECEVPWEVLRTKRFFVGCEAGQRITSNAAEVVVHPCGAPEETVPPRKPTPTLQSQIGDLAKLATKAKDSLVAAVNEIFSNFLPLKGGKLLGSIITRDVRVGGDIDPETGEWSPEAGKGKSSLRVSGTTELFGELLARWASTHFKSVQVDREVRIGGTVEIDNETKIKSSLDVKSKIRAREGAKIEGTLDMAGNDVKNVQSMRMNGTLEVKNDSKLRSIKPQKKVDDTGAEQEVYNIGTDETYYDRGCFKRVRVGIPVRDETGAIVNHEYAELDKAKLESLLSHAVQSNLEQNDPAQPDYIKGRTHWVEDGLVEILPETQATFDEVDNAFVIADAIPGVVTGEKYIVKYNGVEYETVAAEYTEDGITLNALGDLGGASGGVSTGEPFAMIVADAEAAAALGMGALIMPLDGATSVTISITTAGETIHKLDNKYLDLDWLPVCNETPLIAETTVEHSGKLEGLCYDELPVGKRIVVAVDGEKYQTAVMRAGSGTDAVDWIGNIAIFGQEYVGTEYDTGEPFYAVVLSSSLNFLFADGSSHTIAIYDLVPNKLPEEFLPDSVVTRTEFEAALGAYITDVATLVGGDA